MQLPGHKPAADWEHGGAISADDDLQDMSMSPMDGDGFEQVLSDDDGLACVPRQKAVRELEFLDVNSPAVQPSGNCSLPSCIHRRDCGNG